MESESVLPSHFRGYGDKAFLLTAPSVGQNQIQI